jgi:hypothetical protein
MLIYNRGKRKEGCREKERRGGIKGSQSDKLHHTRKTLLERQKKKKKETRRERENSNPFHHDEGGKVKKES